MEKLSSAERAEKFADDFASAVNDYGFDSEAFIAKFKNEHRTLQQSMLRLALKMIEAAGSDNYGTDGRNETGAKACKAILTGFKEEMIKQHGLNRVENFKPSDFLNYV